MSRQVARLLLAATVALAAGGALAAVTGVDVGAPRSPGPPPPRPAVDAYVGSIAVMSLEGDQLAVWSRTALPVGPGGVPGPAGETICPLFMGLPADYARFVAERLRKVGQALGAPVARKDCPKAANNVIIVFPEDAKAFIDTLAKDKPQAFGFRDHEALVLDLQKPVRPIHAWYGVKTVVDGGIGSRLTTPYRSYIYQVMIVVDRDRTDALDMGQLADYLAMVALAQVNPDAAPPAAHSILGVFNDVAAGRPPADGMTRMDAAYLQALYAIGPHQHGSMQESQITSRILAALAKH